MTRSQRAWSESCASLASAPRGADEQAGPEVQGLLPDAVSSAKRLFTLMAASALLIGAVPASALAAKSHEHRQTRPVLACGHNTPALVHSAGMVAPGTGDASHDGSPRVRWLQGCLARAGDAPGPIDGRYGPRTEQAVRRYQAAHGLQVDGIAGPITLGVLSGRPRVVYPGQGFGEHGSRRVRSLQRQLARAGDSPGQIDGRYGPRTEQAVRRYQAAHGLRIDGVADARTLADLTSRRRRTSTARPLDRVVSRHRSRREPHARSERSPHRSQRAVTPRHGEAAPVHRATSWSSLDLAGALIGLIAVLGLAATWLTRRRSDRRDIRGEREFNLAVALEERGDITAAVAAYQRADQLGHGPAASNLGLLLERQGDWTAAAAAYRRADQRGDADGAFNLAVALEERGDITAALAAYQRADQLGHGPAASNLGLLLERQGDWTAAAAAYRRADQRGDAIGAFNLAVALEERGDITAAVAAYQRADQLGHAQGADEWEGAHR